MSFNLLDLKELGEKSFSIDLLFENSPIGRETIPESPGVYIFEDFKGTVLYVGKAINLRRRLLSYGQPPFSLKTASMIKKAGGFKFIVTRNEKEALLLEAQLIKRFRPPYNVILRDDKNYPAIRINIREPFPKLETVRQVKRDGAFYFGPYPSPYAMSEAIKVLRKAFPLRKCPGKSFMKRSRPCLNHDLGLCLAPCAGKISRKEYNAIVRDLIRFLNGNDLRLRERLAEEMHRAAEELNFERAAILRNRLFALDALIEQQAVVSQKRTHRDVMGYFSDGEHTFFSVVYVRGGAVTGHKCFDVGVASDDEPQLLVGFLSQYYDVYPFIPEEILLPIEVDKREELEHYLTELRGAPVTIICGGEHEEDRKLLELAQTNAREYAKSTASDSASRQEVLQLLKDVLDIGVIPRTIACVDISNIQGKHTVGAVVVFKNGRPAPNLYRVYSLEETADQNDPLMIQLTIRRLATEDPEIFSEIDLLMIDGGKGQLQGAMKALEVIKRGDYEVRNCPILVAIAKERNSTSKLERLLGEKLYLSHKPEAILVSEHPHVLGFLQWIRDEAHRYALSSYQKKHRRSLKTSILDAIQGVGPKRKRILLERFGDVEAISNARFEDLLAIPGIPEEVAKNIYEFFHPAR